MLVVFAGLPGTGKTKIAQRVSSQCHATYVRIDTIEQAVRSANVLAGDIGPAGYAVAYALSAENLKLGQTVVADCVNPLSVTRAAWRSVAASASSPIIQVEVICSDKAEHRRRVESRTSDIPGLTPPTWTSVIKHEYESWAEPRIVIDTSHVRTAEAVSIVIAAIDASTCSRPNARGSSDTVRKL